MSEHTLCSYYLSHAPDRNILILLYHSNAALLSYVICFFNQNRIKNILQVYERHLPDLIDLF